MSRTWLILPYSAVMGALEGEGEGGQTTAVETAMNLMYLQLLTMLT
jgi:hypothetical protein